MTDSVSVVCQNLQSYFLMYFVVVVIANCNTFSVFLSAEVEAGEEGLERSADAMCHAYSDKDLELWEALNSGPPYRCIDMSVSFDITWQKREFTYLYGVGMCIDLLTGLVIDYHVVSRYCHVCEVNAKRLPHVELLVWKAVHAPDCCISHNQFSKAME